LLENSRGALHASGESQRGSLPVSRLTEGRELGLAAVLLLHHAKTQSTCTPHAKTSSSLCIIGASSSPFRADPIRARAPDAALDGGDTDDDASCGGALSRPVAERFASSFLTQVSLDALCRKDGVPERYSAILPAGHHRACSPPPPGSVCVYAHALEAGMRVPLHGFFCEALAHFGVAVSNNLDMCVCVAPWVCSWRA